MVEQDTIRLLRECDSGIKMGVDSIDDVLSYVKSKSLRKFLMDNKNKHNVLKKEIRLLLDKYDDQGKNPSVVAKSMSSIKTKIELLVNRSDETIASLITDGCNMGVKSLNKYLNEYEKADEKSKSITKELIDLEEKLAIDIRRFL